MTRRQIRQPEGLAAWFSTAMPDPARSDPAVRSMHPGLATFLFIASPRFSLAWSEQDQSCRPGPVFLLGQADPARNIPRAGAYRPGPVAGLHYLAPFLSDQLAGVTARLSPTPSLLPRNRTNGSDRPTP